MENVICGDSANILEHYPDDHFDSVVTDPPYGIGFLGQAWDNDTGGLDVWKQAYRVLKPGGHLLAFSAPRTYHRLATTVEDAGFEIRDQVIWIFSQRFPKSHNVGKAYDKRIAPTVEFLSCVGLLETMEFVEANPYHGWQTSLKPGHEPIVLARKPFNSSVLDNVLQYETGAMNIDGCRVPGEPLTYPGGGIDRLTFNQGEPDKWDGSLVEGHAGGRYPHNVIGEVEGHQKFFYCPKASTAERNFGKASNAADSKNNHSTVKPVDLMAYLVRLVTPKGGLVLDPFCGSGSTGMGCVQEGMKFVGIELDASYSEIARRRIAAWQASDSP
jgi:site-specific DNA-methyltransferase (adenine-specific)